MPPPRRSLWKALPLFTLVLVFDFAWIGPHLRVGWDFPQFWAMARVPLSERANADTMISAERRILASTDAPEVVPYVRPQAFSLVLRPLAWLDLVPAFHVWLALQLAALGAVLWMLHRAGAPWPMLALVGLYKPVVMGVAMGQDIAMVALLALGAWFCLRSCHEFAAGLLFGLCLYKFNLFWMIPLFLLARKRYHALGTFLITGAVLAAVSCWIMPPSNYLYYLSHIGNYQRLYNPAYLQTGLRGIASYFGLPWAYFFLAVAILGLGWWRLRSLDEEFGFALLITISLFCGYYVTEYDYTLLLIPIFVLIKRGAGVSRILAIAALAVPLVWLYLASQLAFLAAFTAAMLTFGPRSGLRRSGDGWEPGTAAA